MVGGGNLFFAVLTRANSHLHVRLTGCEPDFADEHVFEADTIWAFDGEGEWARAGLERWQSCFPFAFAIGFCLRSGLAKFDRDRLVRSRPAPDHDWFVTLKDHVIPEDFRKTDLRVEAGC